MVIIIFIISVILTYVSINLIRDMIIKNNILGSNFRGKLIPIGLGVSFVPVIIISSGIVYYFDEKDSKIILFLLIGVISMAFVGIVDDLMGNRSVLGIKGHMKNLLKKNLTTGGFKAVLGGIIALFISLTISYSILDIFINMLIISLFTNTINLLDLRPGRAIKSYLLFAALFLILGVEQTIIPIFFSIIAFCIVYLPQDLMGKSMMGDVGSNSLGVSLGIISVVSFSIYIRIFLFILLVCLHIISEKYSITKLIDQNRILTYLDNLGRK